MTKPTTTATKSQTQTSTRGPAPAANIVPAEKKPEAIGGLTVQGFIDHVFDEDRTKQVIASLGDSISFAKFRASVATAIMNSPDLLKCQPALVFREVARVAALGLVFDHHLGEAYLFPSWNKDSKKKDLPQCRVGYRGLMKLARNESNVMLYAHEVHKNDEFECVLGLDKKLIHKPDVFGEDRGEVIGYYAVAKFRDDDDADFEPMSNAEVLKIRDRTETWKAFVAKKITFGGPWQTDEIEMGKKTVIRRLWKRLPSGPKMAAAIKIEDEAEGIVPSEPSPTPAKKPAADGSKNGLDRFAGKGQGGVTDLKPIDDGAADNNSGEDQGGGNDDPGPSDQQQGGGAYVEEEEARPETDGLKVVDKINEEYLGLLALAPKMPQEIEDAWEKDANWMPGWKWINEVLPGIEDAAVRKAFTLEHNFMLHAVAKKSDGYKQAVTRFLGAYSCALTPISEGAES